MDLGAEDVAAKHPTYSNIISIMIPLVIRFKRHRHRIGALQYVSFYNGLLFFTDLFVESICWICRLALAILLQTWGFAAKRKCANKTDWWVTKNVHLPRSLFVRDGHANTECWTARIYVQLHGNLAINEGNVGGKHISRKRSNTNGAHGTYHHQPARKGHFLSSNISAKFTWLSILICSKNAGEHVWTLKFATLSPLKDNKSPSTNPN